MRASSCSIQGLQMRSFSGFLALAILFGTATAGPAWAKTAKECNAEYATNKDAIKGAGQKKKDFVAACKAGTETVPASATAAPAPAPAAPAAPAPAPAQTATPIAPPPAASSTRAKPRTDIPSATTANEFTSEAQATAHCPGQTVVWLNSKSGVYHFAGTKNYGNTKAGAYMCEADATAAGDRASKNEKHP